MATEPANALIASLRRAVDASPADVPLRLHLADLLLAGGDVRGCLAEVTVALAHDAGSTQAHEMLVRAAATLRGDVEPPPPAPLGPFDWDRAEEEVRGITGTVGIRTGDAALGELTTPAVRLSDVAGMVEVKARLEATLLLPMRDPDVASMYGASLHGGLLLYGPPSCGKTFLARAVAGELGARFHHVAMTDLLEVSPGGSVRALRALFASARRSAPCVLFIDGIEAVGHQEDLVSALVAEVERTGGGAAVLAATSRPWDVGSALRRPGRFERALLVPPPDEAARAALLTANLVGRPVGEVDVPALARATEGYCVADLALVCAAATELAMAASARAGTARPIGHADMAGALRRVRPSAGRWFDAARARHWPPVPPGG